MEPTARYLAVVQEALGRIQMWPISTIVGAALLHAVMLEAAAAPAASGPPATFVSANVQGASLEDLRRLIAPYQGRIRFYRSAR